MDRSGRRASRGEQSFASAKDDSTGRALGQVDDGHLEPVSGWRSDGCWNCFDPGRRDTNLSAAPSSLLWSALQPFAGQAAVASARQRERAQRV